MKELEIKRLPKLSFEITEALNQLRVSLGFCGKQVKVVMITSSIPNEGKSFVTIQLWKIMAELGIPVLLIDCDLRNSEMRRKYGIRSVNNEKLIGIVHFLSDQTDIQNVIYKTNIDNGYIIPAVSAITNPAILLKSLNFSKMIEYCRERFSYILVDTPPIGSVVDALDIAKYCDGSILVIHSGETPCKMVENSVHMLEQSGSPLLGVVLNRVGMTNKSKAYYHRYYGSYGYGYGYGYDNYGKDSKSSHVTPIRGPDKNEE